MFHFVYTTFTQYKRSRDANDRIRVGAYLLFSTRRLWFLFSDRWLLCDYVFIGWFSMCRFKLIISVHRSHYSGRFDFERYIQKQNMPRSQTIPQTHPPIMIILRWTLHQTCCVAPEEKQIAKNKKKTNKTSQSKITISIDDHEAKVCFKWDLGLDSHYLASPRISTIASEVLMGGLVWDRRESRLNEYSGFAEHKKYAIQAVVWLNDRRFLCGMCELLLIFCYALISRSILWVIVQNVSFSLRMCANAVHKVS